MSKQKLGLLIIALLLLQTPVQATDILYIYNANRNLERSALLDDTQRLTFENDNLLLKTTSGNETYQLASMGKITFKKMPVTDIPTVKSTVEITLYPNPAIDDVTIESPAKIILWTLFDFNGKTLKQGTTATVQTSNLSAGFYFLKIVTAQGTVTKKIIKQ